MKSCLRRVTVSVLLSVVILILTVLGSIRQTVLTVGVIAGSYWDAPTGNCYAVMDAAIERFEQAHPNVRVEYTSGILKRDYSEWLADQYLLGTEPDVFLVMPEDFGMLAELGALQPLDSLLDSDGEVSAADFYDAALKSGASGGVQYALPYECVPTLMFVNKTLLEAEGIPVPDNDWIWDDFYRICAQVTRDTDDDGVIDQFGSYGYTWRDALAANGAALFDENGTSCLIAQPDCVEAVEFAQKLQALYADCDITARSFDEGHVAFRPFLFSDYRTYQPYPWRIKRYSGFAWDCIQMPGGPSGTGRSELSTVLAAISSRCTQKPLAWELLKELTCSDETQSMLYTDSHGVSALRRVTQSPKTQQILQHDTPGESQLGLELLSDTMEQAVVAPHFRAYDQALLLAESLVTTAMEDDHNLSLQLQRVQRQLNEYLQS